MSVVTIPALAGELRGLPPVVLVHGFASSFEHNWRQPGWADLLTESGRTVIGIDLLGHGTAPKPTDPVAYADLEQHVLDAVAGHDRVDAVGFSLGARVLLTVAARDPGRFRRLVVIGVGENLFRNDDPGPMIRAMESEPGEDDVLARLFASLARSAGNDRAALAAFLRRPPVPLTGEDLARVTCPVLVIIGDRDFAGPGDPLVDALPDARLVVLRGVDHFAATQDFHCIDRTLTFLDAPDA